jgi:hypothetical protein
VRRKGSRPGNSSNPTPLPTPGFERVLASLTCLPLPINRLPHRHCHNLITDRSLCVVSSAQPDRHRACNTTQPSSCLPGRAPLQIPQRTVQSLDLRPRRPAKRGMASVLRYKRMQFLESHNYVLIILQDLTLPKSMIARLAKGVLPANTQIQKDALLAMHKSATVFVSYIASKYAHLYPVLLSMFCVSSTNARLARRPLVS